MIRAGKGLRKIVIDEEIYYWKVQEDDDYYYARELTVLDEAGKLFLIRYYSFDKKGMESSSRDLYEGHKLAITPSIVRNEILEEKEFNQKRAILDLIEYKEAPRNWKRIREIHRPEIIVSIGLDLEEDILVCVRQIKIDSYRRTIIDLTAGEVVLEDFVPSVPINKEKGTYLPFGPLKRQIPFLGWNRYSGKSENINRDMLRCFSFHPQFIYFQPFGEECLQMNRNKGCVRLNRIHPYNKYGFSASEDYFVIAERENLIIWNRYSSR